MVPGRRGGGGGGGGHIVMKCLVSEIECRKVCTHIQEDACRSLWYLLGGLVGTPHTK